jgi:tetratricopeptide (TPR) repeat protein/tRNA A-37 threonylcarbamoyl transferase component Bud32
MTDSEDRGEETATAAGPRRGPPPAASQFSAGDLLAGRYRILRFIARGGMGEVYEAQDLELGERVALKTVRPEIAMDERTMERFRREIHHARRVTHPNVCRTFDIAHHRTEQGQDVTFVSMELLEGETLTERIRRAGRMTTAEAMPLLKQMAAALEAAHEAGIVHRDFKSSNVVLVPARAGTRAVVTDFGLARGGATGDDSASVTGTVGFVGTPAYMAPEQVAGGAITPAADLYALGVVLYEMLTGSWPFEGDTPVSQAVKRLAGPPPSPRARVPDLDRRWERAVLRCLELDPANRFPGAADVVKAVEGEPVAPSRRGRRAAPALAAAGVAVAAAAGVWLSRSRAPAPAAAPPAPSLSAALPPAQVVPRRSVAVLGFRNLSGRPDAAWLSTALAEMLTTELAAGEKLRTIPGESVARMKAELTLVEAESLARDTLGRIRRSIGSDVVVLGSYFADAGGRIRIDLRLQDAAAGDTVASLTESGTQAEVLDLVSRAGRSLRGKLGVGELSTAAASEARAALPSNPQAAELYALGLERLRVFDALAAKDLLQKAVAADPRHALAHSALAEAWSKLGHDAKAGAEAKTAFDLSAALSREHRLSVEGRYREITRDWGDAVAIARTLFGFFPDSLDYGLRLASAQVSAGKGQDALATLEALRRLPPPDSADARIDLVEAQAARSLADSKRQVAAAGRSAQKAQAQGARHLLARARFEEGSALQNLGEPDKARAALEDAGRMFAEAGDRRGVAGSLNNVALVLANRGDYAGARKMSEEALAIYREIGNQSGVALMQGNLGNFHYYGGDLSGARKAYAETLVIYQRLGEKDGVARMLTNIASVQADQGDMAGARKTFEDALSAWRESGHKNGAAITQYSIGQTLLNLGDLPAARARHEEAIATFRETGDKSGLAEALFGLGHVLREAGDLAAARQRYEAALALREELGEAGVALGIRLALADLSLEGGRAAEAEAPARRAAADAEKAGLADPGAEAHALLARALLAQGQRDGARQAAERALQLSAKTENTSVRRTVALAAARVRAATGEPAAGLVRELERALADATRAGLFGPQLHLRLAMGEILVRAGDPAGRARIAELEKDAREKGFLLVARKAEAALTGS